MRGGKRLGFFRLRRGMTQRELGERAGFPPASAGVRVAQYETGWRTPKPELRNRFADVLDVSADALEIPDLDTPAGVMHTLFALEDLYGFQVAETGEGIILRLQTPSCPEKIQSALAAWARLRTERDAGQRAEEEYDQWRWRFAPDVEGGGA